MKRKRKKILIDRKRNRNDEEKCEVYVNCEVFVFCNVQE